MGKASRFAPSRFKEGQLVPEASLVVLMPEAEEEEGAGKEKKAAPGWGFLVFWGRAAYLLRLR